MFNLFKKKAPKPIQLKDLYGQPFGDGAKVKSLRYDIGECEVKYDGERFYYHSAGNEEPIPHTLMIDAATGHQKVLLREEG